MTPVVTSPPDTAVDDLDRIEGWFVRRGVPHFVERTTEGSVLDTWTRALPLLAAAYVLLGFNALDLVEGTVAENLFTAVAVVVIIVATWAVSNRLRGSDTFARPTDIDAPELALFLLGPMIPNLVFGQVGDAFETLAIGLVLLATIYVWSAYGLGPLLRWAARQSTKQLSELGALVGRALPLLLLFNTFLFVNAEVWEVAGTLEGAPFVLVIVVFLGLGASFAISRMPRQIRTLNTFDRWDDVGELVEGTPAAPIDLPETAPAHDRLRFRQRINIGSVVFFGQALQIALVVVVLTAFFVGFGILAISRDTAQAWTRLDDVNVMLEFSLSNRTLVLSEPLLRVSLFLSAFSGMYFTVLLITDQTYREEFSDDVGTEIRQALAVRRAYRIARGVMPDDEPRRAHRP